MQDINTNFNLAQKAAALLAGEHNAIANMANIAALIFMELPGINWAGFYIFDGRDLVLGPFQGRPACVRIALGKGVCGVCADTKQAQLVADVHSFPGHIACDIRSKSELVLPILKTDGSLFAILDIDAPTKNRFSLYDKTVLEFVIGVFKVACKV